MPADGVLPNDKRGFLRKAVSLRRFGEFVRLADSKHVYTIFDSCFAGTIFNVARSAPPPAITRVTSEPVRQFLSSGDAGQTVADDGTFANLFVEAIEGKRRADLNTDGYVTAEELGSFLTNSISNYTNNKQVPRHGKLRDPAYDRGDFVFLASLTRMPTSMVTAPAAAPAFSMDDLIKQDQLKGEWDARIDAMRSAFQQVKAIDVTDGPVELLKSAWTRFVETFQADSPYTSEDSEMLAHANERIATLDRFVVNESAASFIPVPLVRVAPMFPSKAMRVGMEGWVKLVFDVDETGAVQNVRVEDSSNAIFDSNAIKAIQKWKFKPQIRNGRAVPVKDVVQKLDFRLG